MPVRPASSASLISASISATRASISVAGCRRAKAEADVALDRHVGEERVSLKDHADRVTVDGDMGTSHPPMPIAPAEGFSKPAIMRNTVVLPQPLGPRS